MDTRVTIYTKDQIKGKTGVVEKREAVQETIKMYDYIRDNGPQDLLEVKESYILTLKAENRSEGAQNCYLCDFWSCGRQKRYNTDCPLDTDEMNCDHGSVSP